MTHSQDPIVLLCRSHGDSFLGCALLSVSPYDSHMTYCPCDVYCSCDIHCMHYSIVLRVLYSLGLSSMYP
jgi:hypothetical protein